MLCLCYVIPAVLKLSPIWPIMCLVGLNQSTSLFRGDAIWGHVCYLSLKNVAIMATFWSAWSYGTFCLQPTLLWVVDIINTANALLHFAPDLIPLGSDLDCWLTTTAVKCNWVLLSQQQHSFFGSLGWCIFYRKLWRHIVTSRQVCEVSITTLKSAICHQDSKTNNSDV